MEVKDLKLGLVHIGSQVLSPKYEMDAYMATLLGGEAWDLHMTLRWPKVLTWIHDNRELVLHEML